MAKGNPKNKNQQDRTTREAERRQRQDQERRQREEDQRRKEQEKAAQREERERQEHEEEQTPAGPPALVLASVQVFGQMPPHQLYVLTDGSTIATPDMDPALVESTRAAIIGHFAPKEDQAPDAEIPVDPSTQDPADAYEALGDQLDQDSRDEDGNTPEDYTALEGTDPWAAPTQERNVTITIPDGIDPDALTAAIQGAIHNATKGGM